MKFKIGDRIEMNKDYMYTKKGMRGVVTDTDIISYSVKFDEKFEGGHDCNETIEFGYGFFTLEEDMDLCSEPAMPNVDNKVTMIANQNGEFVLYQSNTALTITNINTGEFDKNGIEIKVGQTVSIDLYGNNIPSFGVVKFGKYYSGNSEGFHLGFYVLVDAEEYSIYDDGEIWVEVTLDK